MATYYRGHRFVLRGRDSAAVNPYTGKVGTYSNWAIFDTSHLLTGAPDNDHVPGEGDYPHGVQMSRWYRGLDTTSPMKNPGLGPDTSYMGRITWPDPVPSSVVLSDPGHLKRDNEYGGFSNHFYHGVPSANPLFSGGHTPRAIDEAGTANTFGRFEPDVYKGLTSTKTLVDAGKVKPGAGDADVYGHEHIGEWFGVASAKAL